MFAMVGSVIAKRAFPWGEQEASSMRDVIGRKQCVRGIKLVKRSMDYREQNC